VTFRTVFDAAHEGYASWWFPSHGLIFVCIGVVLVLWPARKREVMPSGWRGRARKIFNWCFLAFAVVWTLSIFGTTFSQYLTAKNALNDGRYDVVEGRITDFIPMPDTGHSKEYVLGRSCCSSKESFIVGGQRFSYSDFIVTSGFHNTASHGGPIREGLYVRVSYLGNLILRLEVAE
jgi:hypothetical protein